MEIPLHDGRSRITLRGSDGEFQICYPVMMKTKESPEVPVEVFIPKKFYASLSQAFEALFKMKLSRCEATTLHELKEEMEAIRKELTATWKAWS